MNTKTYFIDGQQSGWTDWTGSRGWRPEDLYGTDLTDIDEDGRAIVAGRDAAISLAGDLFRSFETPFLGVGDEYRIRYDVVRADGSLVKRFERVARGQ